MDVRLPTAYASEHRCVSPVSFYAERISVMESNRPLTDRAVSGLEKIKTLRKKKLENMKIKDKISFLAYYLLDKIYEYTK